MLNDMNQFNDYVINNANSSGSNNINMSGTNNSKSVQDDISKLTTSNCLITSSLIQIVTNVYSALISLTENNKRSDLNDTIERSFDFIK